jgi:hypothetical protein
MIQSASGSTLEAIDERAHRTLIVRRSSSDQAAILVASEHERLSVPSVRLERGLDVVVACPTRVRPRWVSVIRRSDGTDERD